MRESWPVFEEYYQGIATHSLPVYYSSQMVAVIALVLFLSITYATIPRIRFAYVLHLLSLKSGDNTSSAEHPYRWWVRGFFLLQTLLLSSLLIESLLSATVHVQAASIEEYWIRLITVGGGVVAWGIISMLLYGWIGLTFIPKAHRQVWDISYFVLLSLWSCTLYLPTFALLGGASLELVILLTCVSYILFRGALVIRSLYIFNGRYGGLLHLILYLCSREIVPLLFLLSLARLL